jgi:CheY-like chemotaxis protein
MNELAEILLVEDNPDELELSISALKESNFANPINVARDGEEALDFLFARGAFAERAGRPTPKVILLDLKLPKIDGIEVLRQIRSNPATRTIPVVVLTSSQQERDLVATYDLGANSYIVKPVDIDKFIEAICAIGMYWTMLNERPQS